MYSHMILKDCGTKCNLLPVPDTLISQNSIILNHLSFSQFRNTSSSTKLTSKFWIILLRFLAFS